MVIFHKWVMRNLVCQTSSKCVIDLFASEISTLSDFEITQSGDGIVVLFHDFFD